MKEIDVLKGWIVMPFRIAILSGMIWLGYWLQPISKPLAYYSFLELCGFVLLVYTFALFVRDLFVLVFKGLAGWAR